MAPTRTSPRQLRFAWLTELVRAIHTDSRGIYGWRRVNAQRLGGNRVIPDRLVSLADPDPAPSASAIRVGPMSSATRCCWPRMSAGFIADHQLRRGNPPDVPQLVLAVERVIAVTGRAPGTVVGDRGFGTAANDQALAALGVRRVGPQRTRTPGEARLSG